MFWATFEELKSSEMMTSKTWFSSSCLSFHQLQDGYSNSNSSGAPQQCASQPATPGGALPVPSPLSPSPASLSSYHGDDSDSISSPPWPLKTPSSPVSCTYVCIFSNSHSNTHTHSVILNPNRSPPIFVQQLELWILHVEGKEMLQRFVYFCLAFQPRAYLRFYKYLMILMRKVGCCSCLSVQVQDMNVKVVKWLIIMLTYFRLFISLVMITLLFYFSSYEPAVLFLIISRQKANPNSSSLSGERITRLFELGVEPERRSWVERYLNFMEERGTPVTHLPAVSKKPLDLWKLYIAVREIGGLAMVKFRECTWLILMFGLC